MRQSGGLPLISGSTEITPWFHRVLLPASTGTKRTKTHKMQAPQGSVAWHRPAGAISLISSSPVARTKKCHRFLWHSQSFILCLLWLLSALSFTVVKKFNNGIEIKFDMKGAPVRFDSSGTHQRDVALAQHLFFYINWQWKIVSILCGIHSRRILIRPDIGSCYFQN